MNERILLGMLLAGVHISQVSDKIRKEMFIHPDHASTYKHMVDLDAEGMHITVESVASVHGELRSKGSIADYLFACRHAAVRSKDAVLEDILQLMVTDYVRRTLASTGQDITKWLKDGASNEGVMMDVERRLSDLRALVAEAKGNTMQDYMNLSLEKLDKAYKDQTVDGVPWGFDALNTVACGPMEYGNFYGLLCDSGGGKTSISLQLLRNAAEQGIPSLFLSYEQRPEQCFLQMSIQKLGLSAADVRAAKFKDGEYEKIHHDHAAIAGLPLYIETVSGMSAKEIVVKARHYQRRFGVRFMVIDHAKSVRLNYKLPGFAEQVSDMYKTIRDGARELDIATLLLMQRLRDALARENPVPTRLDAYGGGGAYESLDALIGLYRPSQAYEMKAMTAVNVEQKEKHESRAREQAFDAWAYGLKVRYGKENQSHGLKWVARSTRFENKLTEDRDISTPRYAQAKSGEKMNQYAPMDDDGLPF